MNLHGMSNAEYCRSRGWGVGTRLVGDEGYGPTIIEITALGDEMLIAKAISRNGEPVNDREAPWTLACQDWSTVPNPGTNVPKTQTIVHERCTREGDERAARTGAAHEEER